MDLQIQTLRTIIRPLVAQFGGSYKVPPFDRDLYQACLDEAARRGYPVDGNPSVRTYLKESVGVATNVYAYLDHPTRMWIALYGAGAFYVDDGSVRFPFMIPDIYLFNNRFIGRQQQGDRLLDMLADAMYQAPALFQQLPSNLTITSSMNFVNGCLLELETRSMQHCSFAERYSDYLRVRNFASEAAGYFAFPPEFPVTDYVQAIPDIILFMSTANDVLSFYKEELEGDTTNKISILAAQSKRSKLEILDGMVETCMCLYKNITKILEESLKACTLFKRFAEAGYTGYHMASERYKLVDLKS